MIPFIETRFQGILLTRMLRKSLLHEPGDWSIGQLPGRGAVVCNAHHHTRIVVKPACKRCLHFLRLCDRIEVNHRGSEVWLPLLSRLRLRLAVRLYLLERATECWETGTDASLKPE